MKILYAIQGTGNGHLSRARDIIPELRRHGDVDLLVSGIQADVHLPYEVKYQLKGWSFIFGKHGGVDLFKTQRSMDTLQLLREIRKLPVNVYDLVISDFEPVSAWACKFAGKRCIGLSHQSAVLHPAAPKPRKSDPIGKAILKKYAPCALAYGFHFARFDENIYTPVIRRQIRELEVADHGHITVYLPAYSEERLCRRFKEFGDVRWHIFSKFAKAPYVDDNCTIEPINNESFLHSFATSHGVLCGAGFETPAEALYLRKKLLVTPMRNQYEQQCNAAALEAIGVPVIRSMKRKHMPAIADWLNCGAPPAVDYPDETAAIIDRVIAENA